MKMNLIFSDAKLWQGAHANEHLPHNIQMLATYNPKP